MARYIISPNVETLHGYFSRDLAPVLTVDSGDTVQFRTLDAGWGLEPHPEENPRSRKRHPPPQGSDFVGHALCGPVEVRGAQPGMTLEIQIGTIIPGFFGYTYVGGYPEEVNQRLGLADEPDRMLRWRLDPVVMTGTDQYGNTVALHPFLGVMGMPPPEPGSHSTIPPRIWGGNIDCRELVSGTTLFLPIPVKGALFSAGDGHAAQGDGEVCGLGLECPMDRADLTLIVRDDILLKTPLAETPMSWIAFGFHEDLYEATINALNAILDLMEKRLSLQRNDALGLASVTVDFRITQVVNGVRGVHAVLPKNAFQ